MACTGPIESLGKNLQVFLPHILESLGAQKLKRLEAHTYSHSHQTTWSFILIHSTSFSPQILIMKIRVYAVPSLAVYPSTFIEVKETTVVHGLE